MKNGDKTLRLSAGKPENFSITPIKVFDIFDATKCFLEGNFRGAIAVDGDITEDGYAMLSPDGLAYYFKFLLRAVYGESMVYTNLSTKGGILTIYIKWQNKNNISASDVQELENIARVSGFSPVFDLVGKICSIKIDIALKRERLLTLYAISPRKTYQAFVRVFFL